MSIILVSFNDLNPTNQPAQEWLHTLFDKPLIGIFVIRKYPSLQASNDPCFKASQPRVEPRSPHQTYKPPLRGKSGYKRLYPQTYQSR